MRAAGSRDERPEPGVRDDVHPRQRSLLLAFERDDIVVAVLGESTKPVAEPDGGHDDGRLFPRGLSGAVSKSDLRAKRTRRMGPIELRGQVAAVITEDGLSRGKEHGPSGVTEVVAAQQEHAARLTFPCRPGAGI